jgi:hypothetical protein
MGLCGLSLHDTVERPVAALYIPSCGGESKVTGLRVQAWGWLWRPHMWVRGCVGERLSHRREWCSVKAGGARGHGHPP